ncbi:MAG: Flp family type IVb pilin [Chloroflexota bacterium]
MIQNASAMVMRLLARMEDERGQALAEYGLVLGLIAVVAIAALTILGLAVADKFQVVSDALP